MSSSLNLCKVDLLITQHWSKSCAALIKLLILSLLLLPITVLQSQTVHWSQSSNKNNTQGTVVWIGSIVQSSNSTFYEGQSTLQRLFLVDIPTDPSGKYKVTFKHLATKGTINAYDFLTGWNNAGGSLDGKAISTSNDIDPNCFLTINNCSETGQDNDPVFMICGTLDAAPLVYSNAVSSSSYAGPGGAPAISSGSNVKARVDDWDANFSPAGSNGRRITIQSNATVSNAVLVMTGYDAGTDQFAQYELSWTGPTTANSTYSVLIKMGGHISDGQFYGDDKGASDINGGPYHFKVSNLYLGNAPYDAQHTISLGDRDNQLKGADILVPPPPCDITPQSQSICAGGTSQQFCGPAGMAVYAWSISPAGATLSATNTQCVTVTSNTPGIYTLSLVTTKSGVQSTATCNATLIVNANPTADAGPDQTKCQGAGGNTSFTLAGSVTNGTHSWAQVASTGTANSNIAANTALNGTITVTGIGTVTLRLTSTSNATPSCGTADNDVVLTVNANPTADAGADQTKCQGAGGNTSFTLAGSVTNGTHSWAQVASIGTANSNIAANTALNGTITVTGIGTVTLRLTSTSNATPSCGTADNDVLLTVNPNPTADAGIDQALCQTKPSGPTVFNISGSGTNGTGVWSKFASTGTADVSFGSVNDAATTATVTGVGTVTIRYTITSTNCGTASNDAVLTVNPNPVIACSATPSLIDITSAAHNSQLDVDLSVNADTDPTHYSYTWTEDGAGSFNFNNIKNPVYTAAVLDAGQTVSFTVTVTHIATGCSSVSQCSLTVNTAGSCPEVVTSSICAGTTTNYSANRAPSANETWLWSANNGAVINAPNGQQTVSVTAGNQSFTLKLTISYANTQLSSTECTYDVTVTSCAGNCTYTQGKYGNTSPACDADGSDGTAYVYPTVVDMIKAMLGVGGVPNPLVVGSNGKFVTIPSTTTAAALLNASMPGASTARELFGSCTVDNVPLPACWTAGTNTLATYINKQGKINNVLLSQTIALGLNMRLSGGLSAFVLQAGTYATAARDGDCGSSIAKVRTCVYDPILLQWVVTNEYTFKTITQSVIDALNCKQYPLTVAGLYQLANDALGNAEVSAEIGKECGASLSDINNAVAAINEGFDNCRIFVSWAETPCGTQASRIDITASGVINNSIGSISKLSVSAYPNPFRDNVNFVIASPESGKAVLEVYNLFGQKLQTVYEGFIYAGRSQVVQFNAGTTASGVLIYKLRINENQVTGRIINNRE
jgi:hypothetical protein